MKKLWFFAIVFYGMFIFNHQTMAADDYTTFSKITLAGEARLLESYTEEEVADELTTINKRRFNGWNTKILNQNVSATFISETLLSVYNTGTTPIEYDLQTVTSTTTKTSVSATGSISYKVSGGVKSFKGGLDTSLKMETAYSQSKEIKQTEKFKISIDVNTVVLVYMTGTGKVTNGVARKYILWISSDKGMFEYFTVTDLYPRIEKIGI